MPRARLLKPGFFTNSALGALTPLTRLFFEGLWCVADRAGRLVEDPARLKVEILPYDKARVSELIANLERTGFIARYEVSGVRYIQIVNFLRHQSPHVREPESKLPAPVEHGASHPPSTVPAPGEHQYGPAVPKILIAETVAVDLPSRAREPALPTDPIGRALELAGIEGTGIILDDLAGWEAEHVPRDWIIHGIRTAGEGRKPWAYARQVIETNIRNGRPPEANRNGRSQPRTGSRNRERAAHDATEPVHDPYCGVCLAAKQHAST